MDTNTTNDRSTIGNSARMAIGDDSASSKLVSHATEWWRRALIIDKSLDRLNPEERTAYDYIRGIFDSGEFDIEQIQVHQETLREVGQELRDEFGAAVKTFASKVSIITRDFEGFRRALQEVKSHHADTGGNATPTPVTYDETRGSSTERRHARRMINGDTWEGDFIGDRPVGKGKISFASGNVYEGGWSKMGPDGNGVLTWPNGEIWTATFRDGEPVSGKIEYPGGEVYEGSLNENGPHGFGKKRFSNRTDEGEYRDGCRVGQGRMEWDDGDWYQGGWNDQGYDGYGTLHMVTSKRVDRGTYRSGKRVGEGRIEWEEDGSWYQGGWNDKGKHGHGVYYDGTSKRKDTGEYKDGKRTGRGRMEWEDGDWYEGEWNDKGRHGQGISFYHFENTTRTDNCVYKDGRRNGKGTMKWGNGDWYEGTMIEDSKGNITGEGVYHYANGQTETGYYDGENGWKEGSRPTVVIGGGQKPVEKKTSTVNIDPQPVVRDSDNTWDTIRNIIAWVGTLVLIGFCWAALFGDGAWYEAIGFSLLTFVAKWIYAGIDGDEDGWLNPLSWMGIFLGLSGCVYIYQAFWGSYPWYWFIGGAFWGIIGLSALAIGFDWDD